jgi:hypothetical protein
MQHGNNKHGHHDHDHGEHGHHDQGDGEHAHGEGGVAGPSEYTFFATLVQFTICILDH